MIKCLSFFVVSSWSSSMPLYPQSVASQAACPNSFLFRYFHFRLTFESIKELGSALGDVSCFGKPSTKNFNHHPTYPHHQIMFKKFQLPFNIPPSLDGNWKGWAYATILEKKLIHALFSLLSNEELQLPSNNVGVLDGDWKNLTNCHYSMATKFFKWLGYEGMWYFLENLWHLFWKALIKGFPKSYDTPPFFGNQKTSVAIEQRGVCSMVIKKIWSPFDISPPLDGNQRILVVIYHTHTIRWWLKMFDHQIGKMKVEFLFFFQNDSTCLYPFQRLKILVTIWWWGCVKWHLKKSWSPSIN